MSIPKLFWVYIKHWVCLKKLSMLKPNFEEADGLGIRLSTWRGRVWISFFPKNSFKIHSTKIESFKTETFSDKKCLSWAKTKFSGQKLFPILGSALFFNSSLRQISDYKSISVLIKSDIISICPFFSALCPSKLLF